MFELEHLLSDFERRGIPTNSPDFYDHPNFLNAERSDPSYLNYYAAYVALRSYSETYLENARETIYNAATILHEHLLANGRQGACVDIAGMLARILEKNGVWCACIKGSCTITFPQEINEEKTYFWSLDRGSFTAGHAWLFAPPYKIVDLTIGEQPYSGNKKEYLTGFVLEEQGVASSVEIEDIISPEARLDLAVAGIPQEQLLSVGAPQMQLIQSVFKPIIVNCAEGTELKYCPVAIHASEEPLEGFRNMDFGGLTPFELYEKHIVGKI